MSTVCDVLVVGAGVAGATAAVAAARGGARTILIEKERYLGGTGYAGMFQHICGLYLNSEVMPTETLNDGIVREIVALLDLASPRRTVKKMGQVYVLPYTREDLQSALTTLCYAEKDVATLRGHTVTAVAIENDAVRDVTVEGLRGKQVIKPKMVIDCSGSGVVAALADVAFELAPQEERQLAGYVVRVMGLKNVDENLSLKVPYHLAQAAAAGIVAHATRFTTFSPGDAVDEGYCKMSIAGDEGPGAEERAREQAEVVVNYLRSVIPAFEGASIVDTSLKVLEREGRRIIGEYTLTREDVLAARKFPDGVVKNSWPIELWDRSKGTVYKYVPRGDYYEVPFRCLKARDVANLLMAGRCISVTHEALGSTRVMGACMTLGEQAGKAAAYKVKNGEYPEYTKGY
jgi:hypothetical protein